MSDDKIYAVPTATAARAWIDNKRYEALYRESLESTEAFWAKQARDRLDWIAPFTQVKDMSFDAKRPAHPLVRRRQAQRLGELPRPPSREARRQDRDHLGSATTRTSRAAISYRELHADVCRFANAAEEARRRERRSRHDLHADDSRGRRRDARVRAHRRDALGRVRRLLARFARGPHRRIARRSS